MIDWNAVHDVRMFIEGTTGCLIVFFWPFYIKKHFKKNWSEYKALFKNWPKPEPLFKYVKPHSLRAWCEECDPLPEIDNHGLYGCPSCHWTLTETTMTLPTLAQEGSGIIGYETSHTGWKCDNCKGRWSDEQVRRAQTKFSKTLRGDTTVGGPGFNPSGTIPGWSFRQSYKFYPGGTHIQPGAQAQFFDKSLIAGLGMGNVGVLGAGTIYPPDEGYGDS